MGEGEGARGREGSLRASRAAGDQPSGGTDGEDDVLDAFIAASAEPRGKRFGGHLAATRIEQDENGAVRPCCCRAKRRKRLRS